MGDGDSETAFYDYFDLVFLVSREGGRMAFIHEFNGSMSLEDSESVKTVVPSREYAYIAFRVAPGYTLAVDEFAFFFKGDGASAVSPEEGGTLTIMDFYITDKIPTKLEGAGGQDPVYLPDVSSGFPSETGEVIYTPATETDGSIAERPGEVDESEFEKPGYATARVYVNAAWSSAHLDFDTPQTVKAGQFVVIRVRNNCANSGTAGTAGETASERVSFTFNHLMFRFGRADTPS